MTWSMVATFLEKEMLIWKKGPGPDREEINKAQPIWYRTPEATACGSTDQNIRFLIISESESYKDDRLCRRRGPPGFVLPADFTLWFVLIWCDHRSQWVNFLWPCVLLEPPNRTTRFAFRASRKLTMPLSSTTLSTAPSMSLMSEVLTLSFDFYNIDSSHFLSIHLCHLTDSKFVDFFCLLSAFLHELVISSLLFFFPFTFAVNNPKKSGTTLNEAFLGLLYPTLNYKV